MRRVTLCGFLIREDVGLVVARCKSGANGARDILVRICGRAGGLCGVLEQGRWEGMR
jgi:hypothetical protein